MSSIRRAAVPVPPSRHLVRGKDLADARYAEPIRVADMARAAGLSRGPLQPPVPRTFGESPHQYLLTRRLERAAALLRTTDCTVADICIMVGSRASGSFTTSFRRMFGLTPTAYRAPLIRRPATWPACRPASCGPTAAREPHVSRRRASARP